MPSQPELPPEQPADKSGVVSLACHATTHTAEDLHVRLVLAADGGGAIEIDASGVESVGQAVLQLLVAARAEAIRAAQPFAITRPSAAFVERVTACCLAEAIGLQPASGDPL